MFLRANSRHDLRELQEELARDRSAPKTRILLEGGPMNGIEAELSPLEIAQGMMACCRATAGVREQGKYSPSDQPEVWRYSTLA